MVSLIPRNRGPEHSYNGTTKRPKGTLLEGENLPQLVYGGTQQQQRRSTRRAGLKWHSISECRQVRCPSKEPIKSSVKATLECKACSYEGNARVETGNCTLHCLLHSLRHLQPTGSLLHLVGQDSTPAKRLAFRSGWPQRSGRHLDRANGNLGYCGDAGISRLQLVTLALKQPLFYLLDSIDPGAYAGRQDHPALLGTLPVQETQVCAKKSVALSSLLGPTCPPSAVRACHP